MVTLVGSVMSSTTAPASQYATYAVLPSALGVALCPNTAGVRPRHDSGWPGGGVQSIGAGRPKNGAPNARPPSLPAPQSSARAGAVGSVTSTSWKSPRGVSLNAVLNTSANGCAVSAYTRD